MSDRSDYGLVSTRDALIRTRPRYHPHHYSRPGDSLLDPTRIARGIALVAESARALGFEHGLAGKDRRGLCLYEDHEFQRDDPPHEAIVAAYREAWQRGSARRN